MTHKITGTNGNDYSLSGTTGADEIHGLNGDDSATGDYGNDTIYGDAGSDYLAGGYGDDKLFGGSGDDLLSDQDGNNSFSGAGGNDTIYSYIYDGRSETISGGDGNDVVDISGDGSHTKISGGEGQDTFKLSGHSFTISDFEAGRHGDLLDLGDWQVYFGSNYDGGNAFSEGYVHITQHGHDTLIASSLENFTLHGVDALSLTKDNFLPPNWDPSKALLNLVGVDSWTGNALNNKVDGGTGNQVIHGGDGNDTIYGDKATSHVDSDQLHGDAGNDKVYGSAGDDGIYGDAGDDVLQGGKGRDLLHGGTGADSFVFNDNETGKTTATADRILDFSSADHDKIDLHLVDAVRSGGEDAFNWIGSAAFTGHAGELHFAESGGNTWLSGDTNGDKVADFMIRLDGLHNLAVADIVI